MYLMPLFFFYCSKTFDFLCFQEVQKKSRETKWISPFVPNAPFLYPLKTSENCKGKPHQLLPSRNDNSGNKRCFKIYFAKPTIENPKLLTQDTELQLEIKLFYLKAEKKLNFKIEIICQVVVLKLLKSLIEPIRVLKAIISCKGRSG